MRYVDDFGDEEVVALVLDAVAVQHFLDHGDEDVVLLAQLGHQRCQRLHGDGAELRSALHAADERLDDPRRKVAQIQRVADQVHRFQRRAPDVDVDVGGVEQFDDRWQQQVQVVLQIAAEFLDGLEQLPCGPTTTTMTQSFTRH